jgi:hypothetical protein
MEEQVFKFQISVLRAQAIHIIGVVVVEDQAEMLVVQVQVELEVVVEVMLVMVVVWQVVVEVL